MWNKLVHHGNLGNEKIERLKKEQKSSNVLIDQNPNKERTQNAPR